MASGTDWKGDEAGRRGKARGEIAESIPSITTTARNDVDKTAQACVRVRETFGDSLRRDTSRRRGRRSGRGRIRRIPCSFPSSSATTSTSPSSTAGTTALRRDCARRRFRGTSLRLTRRDRLLRSSPSALPTTSPAAAAPLPTLARLGHSWLPASLLLHLPTLLLEPRQELLLLLERLFSPPRFCLLLRHNVRKTTRSPVMLDGRKLRNLLGLDGGERGGGRRRCEGVECGGRARRDRRRRRSDAIKVLPRRVGTAEVRLGRARAGSAFGWRHSRGGVDGSGCRPGRRRGAKRGRRCGRRVAE